VNKLSTHHRKAVLVAVNITLGLALVASVFFATWANGYGSGRAFGLAKADTAHALELRTQRSAAEAVAELRALEASRTIAGLAAEAKAVAEDNEELKARLAAVRPVVTKTATTAAHKKSTAKSGFQKAGTSSVKALIRRVCALRHLSAADTAAMLELARRESTTGQNSRAYARGRECVGLFQLDSDKGSYANRCDNLWSADHAISYCRSRYGSPSKALADHKAKGWY